MPEGPEIHHITDQLREILIEKVLVDVKVVSGPHQEFKNKLVKELKPILIDIKNKKSKKNIIKIDEVNCKGKFIYIKLVLYKHDNKLIPKSSRYLCNHLGMTGHWRLTEGDHTMVKLFFTTLKNYLESGEPDVLYFDDMRHIGKFSWLTETELNNKLSKLGPDVLTSDFTKKIFINLMNTKKIQNRPIANVLNDQEILSGIGNYLRADILYTSQIHPRTSVKYLTTSNLDTLYSAIKDITSKAYKLNGTTIRTYKSITMEPGGYDPIIYGKKTDPLNNPVEIIKMNGRSVYYVPNIQKN